MNATSTISLEDALRDPLLGKQPVETLQRLAKRLNKSQAKDGENIRAAKIGIQGGFTVDFLSELMPLFLRHRGLHATIRNAPYGAFQTEILDASSAFWEFDADLVFLLPTLRNLHHLPQPTSDESTIDALVEAELKLWHSLWERLEMPVVQFTIAPGPTRSLGEADGLYPGGELHYIREINRRLVREAPSHVSFVDTERLAIQVGPGWHDERLYRLAKQPFSMEALPTIANALAASAAAGLGLSRKALIVDLDNTLWGGEIGDSGLDGIALGPETAEGESFVAFQEYLKALSGRGIVLCVCSKNNERIAREPFENHGAMILQLEDFAEFCANFDDKAANIRAIAKKLNLGLDALVFVDDSPVECALVRENLPQVWTLQLAGDPSGFASLLDCVMAFPTRQLSAEDVSRTESYRKLGEVNSGMQQATDIDSFLQGLSPTAVIESAREDTVERISQLIGKTNQFKLNPTTFSTAEIRDLADHVLAIRFKDRLQDYGIVAVAVTDPEAVDGVLTIRNWVMSCRVFSRRLEFLTFELFSERACALNLPRLRLEYRASGRNGLVGELLPKLGFERGMSEEEFLSTPTDIKGAPPHYIERIGAWPQSGENSSHKQ